MTAAIKKKVERERLNTRIPRGLLGWVKAYAKKKNLSVTQIVVNHFTELKEQSSE